MNSSLIIWCRYIVLNSERSMHGNTWELRGGPFHVRKVWRRHRTASPHSFWRETAVRNGDEGIRLQYSSFSPATICRWGVHKCYKWAEKWGPVFCVGPWEFLVMIVVRWMGNGWGLAQNRCLIWVPLGPTTKANSRGADMEPADIPIWDPSSQAIYGPHIQTLAWRRQASSFILQLVL